MRSLPLTALAVLLISLPCEGRRRGQQYHWTYTTPRAQQAAPPTSPTGFVPAGPEFPHLYEKAGALYFQSTNGRPQPLTIGEQGTILFNGAYYPHVDEQAVRYYQKVRTTNPAAWERIRSRLTMPGGDKLLERIAPRGSVEGPTPPMAATPSDPKPEESTPERKVEPSPPAEPPKNEATPSEGKPNRPKRPKAETSPARRNSEGKPGHTPEEKLPNERPVEGNASNEAFVKAKEIFNRGAVPKTAETSTNQDTVSQADLRCVSQTGENDYAMMLFLNEAKRTGSDGEPQMATLFDVLEEIDPRDNYRPNSSPDSERPTRNIDPQQTWKMNALEENGKGMTFSQKRPWKREFELRNDGEGKPMLFVTYFQGDEIKEQWVCGPPQSAPEKQTKRPLDFPPHDLAEKATATDARQWKKLSEQIPETSGQRPLDVVCPGNGLPTKETIKFTSEGDLLLPNGEVCSPQSSALENGVVFTKANLDPCPSPKAISLRTAPVDGKQQLLVSISENGKTRHCVPDVPFEIEKPTKTATRGTAVRFDPNGFTPFITNRATVEELGNLASDIPDAIRPALTPYDRRKIRDVTQAKATERAASQMYADAMKRYFETGKLPQTADLRTTANQALERLGYEGRLPPIDLENLKRMLDTDKKIDTLKPGSMDAILGAAEVLRRFYLNGEFLTVLPSQIDSAERSLREVDDPGLEPYLSELNRLRQIQRWVR